MSSQSAAPIEGSPSNVGNNNSQYPTKDTTFTKIFVGGLPYHTTDVSLRNFFEKFGEIEEAVVITDRQTGKSRGYGFVTMMKQEDAFNAIMDPNPCIDGRKANVNLAVLGAKPRNIAGVQNPANLLALANADLNYLGQFAPAPAPAPPTSLFGVGQVNPAILSNIFALNGAVAAAAATPRPLYPTTSNPTNPVNQMSQTPTEFSRQQNPYLNHTASVLSTPNPFALAQLMYGTSPWLDGGQHRHAYNSAPNPLALPGVGGFTGPFSTDVDCLTQGAFSQQQPHPQQQQQQIAAQLMAGDALTKQTTVAPSVWPSVFPAHATAPVVTTSVMNSTRASPAFAMVSGSTANPIGIGGQMFENVGDTTSAAAATAAQQTQLRGFM